MAQLEATPIISNNATSAVRSARAELLAVFNDVVQHLVLFAEPPTEHDGDLERSETSIGLSGVCSLLPSTTSVQCSGVLGRR